MKAPAFLIKPISASLFWGLIGGLSLIAITFLSTKGLIQILPYPFILFAAILVLKFNDTSEKAFIRMLWVGLSVFIIMSIILILYIQLFVNQSSGIGVIGYLWRFGFIIGVGFISSLLLAILAKPVKK